jgi:hypothetical protein
MERHVNSARQMKTAQPLVTQIRVDAFAAAALRLLAWLLGAFLRFGLTGRRKRLNRVLNHAERAVERILFLHAVARSGPLKKKLRIPRSTPRGFRSGRTRYRLFFKSVCIRARGAGAFTRVMALIKALRRPERAIAHFLKRIRKGVRGPALVVAAPLAEASACAFLAAPHAALDSS